MTDDRFQIFSLMADKILPEFRAVFQNPHFIDTFATVCDYDHMFDNLPVMADKILQQYRAVFQNPHFIYTFATVYD